MPFFRRHGKKRRFHDSRRDCQELTYFRRQEMPIPPNYNPASGSGGITRPDSGILDTPSIPSGTGVVGDDSTMTYVESPISQAIGRYQFDFSRWLAQTFGRPLQSTTVNPLLYQYSLVSYFKYLRFGTATMRIERVDFQSNSRFLVSGATTPLTSTSTVPQRVKLWWLRPGTHDPSFDPALLTPEYFRGHPRARFAHLKVRGSIKFRFHPVCFVPPRYTESTTRVLSTSTGIPEEVQYRRLELLSRPKRLGFIPCALVQQTLQFVRNTPTPTVRFAGSNNSIHRILSPSIYFMWEEVQLGNYNPLNTVTSAPLSEVFIRRSESCSVTFRSLIPFQASLYVDVEGNLRQSAGIGAIETTYNYNGGGPGTAPIPTIEVFDPPRFSSVTVDPGEDPLYRSGAPGVAPYADSTVPLDTEIGLAPYNAAGIPGYGPQQLPGTAGP